MNTVRPSERSAIGEMCVLSWYWSCVCSVLVLVMCGSRLGIGEVWVASWTELSADALAHRSAVRYKQFAPNLLSSSTLVSKQQEYSYELTMSSSRGAQGDHYASAKMDEAQGRRRRKITDKTSIFRASPTVGR